MLINPIHKFIGISSFVGDLLNLEVEEYVFGDLNHVLELFPALYILGYPILIKVFTAFCIPPTFGILCDVDYFQIFYPNIFY